MMHRAFGIILMILMFGLALGQISQDQVIEIRVARGDTVATIAKTYLANPGDWPEIARLNRLADPNRISPGQILIVPVRLLKEVPAEGVVSFLSGTAEIQAPGSSEWTPLALRSRISEGSLVRTKEASVLEIAFENGDSCLLRPQTTLGFPTIRKQQDSFLKRLFLQAGKVILRIRKATGAESRTEIRTPSAQCVIRGTVFRTSFGADEMSRVEVLEGTIAVEAMKTRVEVPAGFGTAVRKGEGPLPPRALLPGPKPIGIEPVYKSLPFSIKFGSLPGAVSYVAALSRDREGKDVAAEAVFTPGDLFRVETVPDGVYYLQSRAFDDLGLEGLPADPIEVRVRTHPRPLDLNAPAGGFRWRVGKLSLAWPKEEGAVNYRVQVAEDPDFARIVSDKSDPEPAWAMTLLAAGTFYLRALSIAADGFESAWSPSVLVKVAPPLAAPILEKPEIKGSQVFLRWNDNGAGVLYRCQVSRDPCFFALIHDSLTPEHGLTIPKPTDTGVYYAQVKALDAQGGESPYSLPQNFKIGRGIAGWLSLCFLFALGVLIYLIV